MDFGWIWMVGYGRLCCSVCPTQWILTWPFGGRTRVKAGLLSASATSVHVNVPEYNRFDQVDPSPLPTACILLLILCSPRGSWHWDAEKRIGDRHHLHHHDDNGLSAYCHQSYSHQVGLSHYEEGWENDTVTLPQCKNLPSNIDDNFEGKQLFNSSLN